MPFPHHVCASFMMWSIYSNSLASNRVKRSCREESQAFPECSDDKVCSNASRIERLECPVCCDSFNIAGNVPYVLWCGHTLCKNCILALQWGFVNIPLFIACPWCHLLSFRLVYKGNLIFPGKNFFLLWMLDSLNGHRFELVPLGNQTSNSNLRRTSVSHGSGQWGTNRDNGGSDGERRRFSLRKSLDFFIHFPLAIFLLPIVLFAVSCSATILSFHLLVTVLFAIPSFLVLYFAYPILQRLVREITS